MITFESVSGELYDGIEVAVPGWVRGHVLRLVDAAGFEADASLDDEISAASQACLDDLMPKLAALFETDVDHQRTNPLALVRSAVAFPTAVLAARGVPHLVRDDFAEENFPDDVYDLSPASFADVAPELHELGIAWGAAKAHTHLARRREMGA